jgi:hypothetical protein
MEHGDIERMLNASGTPAEVAARAGNSARVLHDVYLHCTIGQEDIVSQRIKDALDADARIESSPPVRFLGSGSSTGQHQDRKAHVF